MTIVLVIIGVLIGAQFVDGFGLLPGGLLGYLLGTVLKLNSKVAELELALARIKAALNYQKQTPVTEAVSNTTHNEPAAPPAAVVKPMPEPNLIQPVVNVQPSAKLQPDVSTEAALSSPWSSSSQPDLADSAVIKYIKNYFSGPNLMVRVGVIVLFFGVGFLLKYAAERSQISLEFKLMAVAIGAIVMLIIGWRLRERNADYAVVMQGGSIGVLYLTIFTALRIYQALPPTLALLLLIAIGIFSATLAILQNARSLAIVGICGGFLAPILTSTGGGSHIVLFSYYALLNAGIFGMAWFKAWRPLNLLGFFFTFVIGIAWGVTKYDASNYLSSQLFLIIFFLFYVSISILYAWRQAPVLTSYVDGTLVFGTPLIVYGLQAGMMQQSSMLNSFEYGLAVSSVVLSLFYLTTAKILFDRQQLNLRLLVESFIALGVVFSTLAIPMALDGRWTSASWALEGAAILWMGLRQNKLLPRVSGVLLQLAAGFSLLLDFDYHYAAWPILNSIYVGSALLALAGLFCAWYLQHNRARIKDYEHTLSYVLLVWGLIWWLVSGLREIDQFVPYQYQHLAWLLFFAVSAAIFSVLNKQLNWRAALLPALGLMPVMLIIACIQWLNVAHPFAGFSTIGWIVAAVSAYWLLYRHDSVLEKSVTPLFHAGLLWLLVFVVSWEASWWMDYLVPGPGVWSLLAWALVPAITVTVICLAGKKINWPIAKYFSMYLRIIAAAMVLYLWLWTLLSNVSSDGNPYPLAYLPLLNPLDITQLFVFIVLAFWLLGIRINKIAVTEMVYLNALYAATGAAVFVWLNAVLLRSLHYWANIPYELDTMSDSSLVQSSVSIFWSMLALILMRFATRKQLRKLWIVGGVLMAVVVVKLFTVDIAGVGSLTRIVSFIGVAILMLIMGYIAPLPANRSGENNA